MKKQEITIRLSYFAIAAFFMLTASVFAWGQTTIAVQDFEVMPATPTLAYTTSGNGISISTGQNPSTGAPANANLFVSGERGLQAVNTGSATSTVLFANQSLAGFTGNFVDFRLAGMSINSTNGIDAADNVTLAVSLDGGMTFSNEVRISGSAANQRYDFTATGASTTTYDGDNTPTLVTTSSGAAGISTVRLNLPNTASQVQIRITFLNNDLNERWVIDDVRIAGTSTAGPTAAAAQISGRVIAGRRGASRELVMLSGGDLEDPIYTTTNNFGYYRFEDLTVGETYVLQVISKRYRFDNPSIVISLQDNILNADFTALSK